MEQTFFLIAAFYFPLNNIKQLFVNPPDTYKSICCQLLPYEIYYLQLFQFCQDIFIWNVRDLVGSMVFGMGMI